MKSFAFLAAIAVAVVVAAPASAATLVNLQGSDTVTLIQDKDPGLVLQTKSINSSFGFDFTALNQTKTVKLFDLFTNETSVNSDDLASSPIHVGFDFSSPSKVTNVTVSGQTEGQSFLFGAIQDGAVNWSGSETVTFANGSEVLVSLNNATFNTGFFGLKPGQKAGADIVASFTLLKGPSAVPEPATWAMMLTGFGGLGAVMRKRRREGLAAV